MPLTSKFPEDTVTALEKDDILKDVLHASEFKPTGIVSATYSPQHHVKLGNVLTVPDTQHLPHISFAYSKDESHSIDESNDLFTIVMTDPDAPSRHDHKWSEYCHYVKTDTKLVKGKTVKNNDGREFIETEFEEGTGTELFKYMGPGPPPHTGLHRYIFMIFKQSKDIPSSKFTTIKDRPNWGYGTPATGVYKWEKENGLQLLAVNFFNCEAAS